MPQHVQYKENERAFVNIGTQSNDGLRVDFCIGDFSDVGERRWTIVRNGKVRPTQQYGSIS